jgi:hypothetical protein
MAVERLTVADWASDLAPTHWAGLLVTLFASIDRPGDLAVFRN